MNRREKIEEEIDKTIACFNQTEKLEANPYFFTRLKSKLEESQKGGHVTLMKYLQTWLRPAMLILVLLMNAVTIFLLFQGHKEDSVSSPREELVNAFAQEYGLDQDQFHPFNNE